MADTNKHGKKQRPPEPDQPAGQHDTSTTGQQVEKDPAVEWGERINTGKVIARGGKSTGHVPGATEQKR